MAKRIEMSGKTFGRLTVIDCAGKDKNNSLTWRCLCTCGNITVVDGRSLRRGNTRSCGCLSIETCIKHPNSRTHGKTGTRIYRIWKAMKNRCYNQNTRDYKKWYGSKGVSVCDEWRDNFVAFYNWSMKNGYNDNLSIDRIDPFGNYEPSNCRWADSKTQNQNKREMVKEHDSKKEAS